LGRRGAGGSQGVPWCGRGGGGGCRRRGRVGFWSGGGAGGGRRRPRRGSSGQEAPRRIRIRGRRDGDERIGVRHHHPFGGVRVVGRAAQHRRARVDGDDPRQGPVLAARIADHADAIARNDGAATQVRGADAGDDRGTGGGGGEV